MYNKYIMFRLARFLKGCRVYAFLAPLFKLLETATELAMPIFMANLIDNGIANGDTAYIARQCIWLAALTFVSLACVLIAQWLASVASIRMGANIRTGLLKKIGGFSYSQLDKFGTPTLTNRATNDVIQVQTAAAMFIRLLMRLPFICIGGIVMAIIINARMSLVLIFFVPVFALILFLTLRKTAPLYRGAQRSLDKLTVVVRENVYGTRVVRAFNKAPDEREHFGRVNGAYNVIAARAGVFAALFTPLSALIMNAAILAVLLLGGGIHATWFGMTSGHLIAFINYLTQIMTALVVVANLSQYFIRASASARRINEVLDMPREATEQCRPALTGAPQEGNFSAVEFKNVFFSYGGKNVLTNISFTLAAGETLGVIGGTGSGKSTLVNMLPRFYGPNEGVITLFGRDAVEYDAETLRRNIGFVPQQALLFSGTIADNLRWGNPAATEDEMIEACKIAQAWEFIEKLPHKFETVLVEGGKNLSGGQKQRLTIARALMRRPKILILDDSASALDAKTDLRLRRALKGLKDITALIVSQRVSAVSDADKIIVLNEGNIAGMGTHKELLQNCPLYKEIVASQN